MTTERQLFLPQLRLRENLKKWTVTSRPLKAGQALRGSRAALLSLPAGPVSRSDLAVPGRPGLSLLAHGLLPGPLQNPRLCPRVAQRPPGALRTEGPLCGRHYAEHPRTIQRVRECGAPMKPAMRRSTWERVSEWGKAEAKVGCPSGDAGTLSCFLRRGRLSSPCLEAPLPGAPSVPAVPPQGGLLDSRSLT